jgi:hypothetical protein
MLHERRHLPLPGGRSVREKARTSPESQSCQARGKCILRGDILSPPGNTHGGRAAVVHCRGLVEDIITMIGAVMTDKTGWSCPIDIARQIA